MLIFISDQISVCLIIWCLLLIAQFNSNSFTMIVEISIILSDQPFRDFECRSYTDFLEYGPTGIIWTRVVYNANENGLLPALSFRCRKTVSRQFNGAPSKPQEAWKERKLFNMKSGKVLQNISNSFVLMKYFHCKNRFLVLTSTTSTSRSTLFSGKPYF